MFTWTTDAKVFGMTYGALAGIPVATGDLRPTAGEVTSSGFGLGDVLVTPVSLYLARETFDFQVQFTVWTASGRYAPGATDNRGAGFASLGLGRGVYYPGAIVSLAVRWRVSDRTLNGTRSPRRRHRRRLGCGAGFARAIIRIDAGVSGFGTWQLTAQEGGDTGTWALSISGRRARGQCIERPFAIRVAHSGSSTPQRGQRKQPLDHSQLPLVSEVVMDVVVPAGSPECWRPLALPNSAPG
jgi:hypothetical protein